MDRLEQLRDTILPVLLPCGIRRVTVYGSYARGEETPESDIDLLVELAPPGDRSPIGLKWFGMEEELERLLGRHVEIVTEDALSPYVRPHVDREKVVLYDERRSGVLAAHR